MEKNPLEILLEDIRGSEERLSARIDHVDFRLNTLNTKIYQVKDDLAAHRTDTEAHPRWQVREPSE